MKKKKIGYILLLSVCLLVLGNIIFSLYHNYQNRKLNEQLRDVFHQDDIEKEDSNKIMASYLPLLDINDEVIGWITIEGTNIDYPVLKTDNNDYYLDRDINGGKTENGSIFMDFRNIGDATDRHTILYGHHTKDKTMFTNLMGYKEKDFFYQYDNIMFSTLYKNIEWEIFSAYVTSIDFYYIVTNFKNDADYLSFINTLQDKSKFQTDIKLTSEDQILTLSTCTYEFDNARFVVHARKKK